MNATLAFDQKHDRSPRPQCEIKLQRLRALVENHALNLLFLLGGECASTSLQTATAVNDYVGTQAPGSDAPENLVAVHIDHTGASYTYQNSSVAGIPANPVTNSAGVAGQWQLYTSFGDSTGINGMPGIQPYGLVAELKSRFAFYIAQSSMQLAAMVPRQSSACVTPTAAATYQYVILPGVSFATSTDVAWGSVQLAPGSGALNFTSAVQNTEGNTAASTNLIPFTSAACVHAAGSPELGY